MACWLCIAVNLCFPFFILYDFDNVNQKDCTDLEIAI